MNNTILSTSNCGNPSLRAFGFGPASGDGFGIGYIIKEESISISVSSKHRQTKRFVDTLQSYFLEIRHLLRATQTRDAPQLGARAAEKLNNPPRLARQKSGKIIKPTGSSVEDNASFSSRSEEGSDGEAGMLGGYGYFDAGSVAQLLEKRNKPAAENVGAALQRKQAVGRKVTLAEYYV